MTFSKKQYVERYRADAFNADMPVDTGCTFNMLDNITHMVDEAGGYLINHVDHAGASSLATPFGGSYRSSYISASTVATTITRNGLYPNYSLRLAVRIVGGGSATARLSLLTNGTSYPVRGATNGVLGSLTGSTGSSTGAWCIEGLITNVDPSRCPIDETSIPHYNDAYEPTTSRCLITVVAEVYGLGITSPAGYAGVIGMQVREYPREI